MYELPMQYMINDTVYHIRNKGDYRMVLDCFSALNDLELREDLRIATALIIFYEEIGDLDDLMNLEGDIEELSSNMFDFFNAGRTDSPGTEMPYKIIDWEDDEMLIVSAINNVAHTEIRLEPYIHWWTFLGYYNAIGECPLSHVIGIRYKIAAGKKLEKDEQEFKNRNPQLFMSREQREAEKEADEWLSKIWNKD